MDIINTLSSTYAAHSRAEAGKKARNWVRTVSCLGENKESTRTQHARISCCQGVKTKADKRKLSFVSQLHSLDYNSNYITSSCVSPLRPRRTSQVKLWRRLFELTRNLLEKDYTIQQYCNNDSINKATAVRVESQVSVIRLSQAAVTPELRVHSFCSLDRVSKLMS